MKKQRQQTPVNHDFFKVWTPEMAYVLGFWFADGNITHPNDRFVYCVSFRSSDLDHLVLIRNLMESKHKIYDKKDGSFALMIGSKTLWEDIQVLGGQPCKSLTAVFPAIPSDYLSHFVRGNIDGDGSVMWDKQPHSFQPCVAVCGTRMFLQGMSESIESEIGLPARKVYQHKNKVPFIKWTGVNAKLLAHWCYSGAETVSLSRKRNIAHQFMDWQPRQFKVSFVTTKMRETFRELLPTATD